MTLQLSETSPGVHMSMWQHPKSGIERTVVIIESLGQFTVYIDGEAMDRDLPTYDAAVSRALANLTASKSNKVVMTAAALVAFAVIGGAGVGISKLIAATGDTTLDVSTGTPTAKLDPYAPAKSVSKIAASKIATKSARDVAAPPTIRPTKAKPISKSAVNKTTVAAVSESKFAPTSGISADVAGSFTENESAETAKVAPRSAPREKAAPAPVRVFSASRPALAENQTASSSNSAAPAAPDEAREATALTQSPAASDTASRMQAPPVQPAQSKTAALNAAPVADEPAPIPVRNPLETWQNGAPANPRQQSPAAQKATVLSRETSTLPAGQVQVARPQAERLVTKHPVTARKRSKGHDSRSTIRRTVKTRKLRTAKRTTTARRKMIRRSRHRTTSSRRRYTPRRVVRAPRRVMRCTSFGCGWAYAY